METSDNKTSITEGLAKVCFPGQKDVFYNPVQEFNRDLSIAVLRIFASNHNNDKDKKQTEKAPLPAAGEQCQDGIRILEALAASGLRSIRYAREIRGIWAILANDISSAAIQSITSNVASNNVQALVKPNHGDACVVMYQHRNKDKFDCVDIDPYGSPSPFIDAAVQCVADGGLLMITATDMAILCGNLPESCFAKYGSVSLKNKACHEMALRILLQAIQVSAARYGRYIRPLLSVSVDFYVRLYMQVFTGKNESKSAASKLSMVYQCVNCHAHFFQPLMKATGAGKYSRADGPPTDKSCEYCHSRLNLGGPIWTDPIHDQDFVATLLASLDDETNGPLGTEKRIRGILSVIHEELPDVPLYYGLDRMASFLKLSCPPLMELRSALLNVGHRVSLSHCYKHSVKTDAPLSVVWDVMLSFARLQRPEKEWPQPLPDKPSASDYILNRSVGIEVSFAAHPMANPESRKQKLVRFQANPEKFWGPKARAKSGGESLPKMKKQRMDDEDNETPN